MITEADRVSSNLLRRRQEAERGAEICRCAINDYSEACEALKENTSFDGG